MLNRAWLSLRFDDIFTFGGKLIGTLDKAKYKKGNKPPGLGKMVLNRFLPIMLAFLFAFNLFYPKVHTSGILRASQFSSLQALSLHHVNFWVSHPMGIKKLSLAVDPINETEEDDVETDSFSFYSPFAYFAFTNAHSLPDQTLSTIPAPFFQKRATVPLFILFHSWKNFLH